MATTPYSIDRTSGVTYSSSPTTRTTTNPMASLPRGVADVYANPGYDQPYTPGTATANRVPNPLSVFNQLQPQPRPTYYPTGGGGGGGGTPPPDYSQWGGWAAQAKPGMIGFNPLEQTYLDWDPSMFDRADQGIKTGIADARKRGGTALDLAARQYMDYRDPYASGPKAFNPGVDPRLVRSMEAWGGAGSGAAAQQNNLANLADAGMGNVYDLLSKIGMRYNADQLNAVQGDRMQFDQGIDMANNELGLASNMARARAYSDWRTRDNDQRNQTAMVNWARQNQVGDTNVDTTNQWNASVLDAILSMIGSGGTGIPAPGNDLSRLITLPQYGGV